MKDFIPNDYLTVQMDFNDEIELFSTITHKATIRGAFFTEFDSKTTVSVYAPTGRMIANVKDRQQGILRFEVMQEGLYKFKIQALKPCKVTLALELPIEEDYDDIHEDLLL